MIRSRILATAFAVATVGFATNANAQVTANNTVNVTVGTLLKLTLSTNNINAPAPVVADFDAGKQDVTGPVATVKANKGWSLDVTGSWTAAPYSKAAGDFKWDKTCTSPTYPNSLAASGNAGSGASGTNSTAVNMCYEIVWAYANDVPGSYTATVTYTLTAP